jgi:hypothetical protein
MEPTVELHVRSLSPTAAGGRVRKVVGRLAALDDGGCLDGYAVRVTGGELPTTPRVPTDTGAALRRRLDRCRAWADERGAELVGVRERETPAGRELVLPALLLAEYRDGDLAYVAPHDDGERVRTVADRLDALARQPAEAVATP